MGKPMIMGRKTFESFAAPLPGRRHIVLTRDRAWRAQGAEVAHDISGAIALAAGPASVIGGAKIYAAFLPVCTRIELTEVHLAPLGDAIVPAFTGWREIAREDFAVSGDTPAYSFVTLVPPTGAAPPTPL